MIDSLKGFLARRGKFGWRRMTESQKRGVQAAIDAAIDHRLDTQAESVDVLQLARRIAHEALLNYPADRSCYSCDFYRGERFCQKWNLEAPDEDVLEEGCDHHQTHGAPF